MGKAVGMNHGGKRLLVVEDDDIISDGLKAAIVSEGHMSEEKADVPCQDAAQGLEEQGENRGRDC